MIPGTTAPAERRPEWLVGLVLRGTLRFGEPMARHCTWRAGGLAERFFEPADLDDLLAYLRVAPASEPLTWVGLGSNLLVRDGGIAGTVISTSGGLATLEWLDHYRLRVGAGAACAKVARLAAQRGLGGGEFLAGIPGTVGGALAMNAGAFGGEIWSLVEAVEILDRGGRLQVRDAAAFKVAYRSVTLDLDEWFVAVTLRLAADEDAARKVRALVARRNETQPLGLPSCGSTFKNPPGDFAGRLIEAAGLKGARLGGAYVSSKHANFLINDGSASAADIEGLMEQVRTTVQERCGVLLESEVRVVGRAGGLR